MFTIIGVIVCGVLLGYLLRNKITPKPVSKIITYIIYLLLLVLGITVGTNDHIINNLSSIGVTALIITLGSMICSALIALLIYKKLYAKQTPNNEK